jgi:hypothetical protein
MMEEAGIAADAPLIALGAIASIPTSSTNASSGDPRSTFVIERARAPAFAARLPADFTIAMSREHNASLAILRGSREAAAVGQQQGGAVRVQ